jgi:hypothetical protein
MATIDINSTSNVFTDGVINLPKGIQIDGGADGAFAIRANQIGWGSSSFLSKEFATTQELLTHIENGITNASKPSDEVITPIISYYLETHDISTDLSLSAGEKSTSYIVTGVDVVLKDESTNDYVVKYTYVSAPVAADYWDVYTPNNGPELDPIG